MRQSDHCASRPKRRIDFVGFGPCTGYNTTKSTRALCAFLVVSSIERSLSFYRELLEPIGWTALREARGERGETIYYLSVEGPGMAALGLREKRSDAHPVPHDRYAVGVHHVCFDVPSRDVVDERAEWLRARGAEIESGPSEYDYTPGYYAVFFYDPDRIKLEVLHRPTYWDWIREEAAQP